MTTTLTYRVPGMTCGHCETALKKELGAVPGVELVHVDLATKTVIVHGDDLVDVALRAAIGDAGYEAE